MSRTAPWVKVPLSQGVSQTFDFSVTMTTMTTITTITTITTVTTMTKETAI